MAAVQGGIKRGSSIGRLSRNSSFAAEVGKVGAALARGSSLIVDIEAQAQRGAHVSYADMPQSAPPRHSVPLQSVPSQGEASPAAWGETLSRWRPLLCHGAARAVRLVVSMSKSPT